MDMLAPYLSGILTAYSVFVVATLSPGPALLATLGTAMGCGRRAGILLGLGVVFGSFCWAVLAALGLSALIAAYVGALDLIKIAGGLYLLWLAYRTVRSAAKARPLPSGTVPEAQRSPMGHFIRGWAIHMTNPKAILAWIAIISLGLQPGAPAGVAIAIIAGTTAFAIVFYCLCAVAFSTPAMVRVYGRAQRWIDGALGLFFGFAAYKLLAR